MSDENEANQITDDITKNTRKQSVEDICEELDEKFDEKLNKLKQETEDSFKIDETDLSGELTKAIYKIHVYLTKLMEERILLNRISRKRDDVHGEVYGRLKKGEQIRFDSKGEVEEWINRNPKWIKINTWYENQKVICDLYSGILDGLKQKQWALRNKTDLKKLELGVS